MRIKFLFALCSALSICLGVHADGAQAVKRGTFPYMAFLYYPDETVVDGAGSRFLRGAILIRPDWLVTSAVGLSIVPDAIKGFPQKTLLARLGAIAIDITFTLNEDEDEQEREVIQIVRPFNHSATQWWRTDISLMKTLLPFKLTSAVDTTTLSYKTGIPEKTCAILVYVKKGDNITEDRILMRKHVEMLPPSNQNCGSHYIGNTMTCATNSDNNKNTINETTFCQGNSGGPLICENEVVGIQTYIDNDCKQPHLYQLLSAWENFITCGTEDKCQEEQCSQICDVINKDQLLKTTIPPSETTETSSETTSSHITEVSTEPTKRSTEPTKVSSELPKATLTQADSSTEPQGTSTTPSTIIYDNEIPPRVSMTGVKSEEAKTKTIPLVYNDGISTQSVSEGTTKLAKTQRWPEDRNEPHQGEEVKLPPEEVQDPWGERRFMSLPGLRPRKMRTWNKASKPLMSSNILLGFFILAYLS